MVLSWGPVYTLFESELWSYVVMQPPHWLKTPTLQPKCACVDNHRGSITRTVGFFSIFVRPLSGPYQIFVRASARQVHLPQMPKCYRTEEQIFNHGENSMNILKRKARMEVFIKHSVLWRFLDRGLQV